MWANPPHTQLSFANLGGESSQLKAFSPQSRQNKFPCMSRCKATPLALTLTQSHARMHLLPYRLEGCPHSVIHCFRCLSNFNILISEATKTNTQHLSSHIVVAPSTFSCCTTSYLYVRVCGLRLHADATTHPCNFFTYGLFCFLYFLICFRCFLRPAASFILL